MRFLAAVFLIAVLSGTAVAGPGELISASEYGDKWAFEPEQLLLSCIGGLAVVVMDPVTEEAYPLNGPANVQAKRLQLAPLANIWKDNAELPGTKVSVGPFIERGLSICKR